MIETSKYRVLAALSQDDLTNHGCDACSGCDTLKEAKARARYYLTEKYLRSSEASQRLGYAQVINFEGEVIADFFA